MKRLYVPSDGTCSWRARLAEPSLHWKREASAMELAVSWELAARTPRGLPDSVSRVLDMHPSTRDARLLFGLPEHLVPLRGGSRASQTDLWAVLRVDDGWVSLAVEGKAREPFGPTINEWLRESTPGKRSRLDALCEALGVRPTPVLRAEISTVSSLGMGRTRSVQNWSTDGDDARAEFLSRECRLVGLQVIRRIVRRHGVSRRNLRGALSRRRATAVRVG